MYVLIIVYHIQEQKKPFIPPLVEEGDFWQIRLNRSLVGKPPIDRLLAEAGYTGEPLLLATYPKHETDARWVADQCQQAGVRVDVQIYSWEDMLKPEVKQAADFILFEVVLCQEHVSEMDLLQSTASFVRSHLSPVLAEEVDDRISRMLEEPDAEKHAASMLQVETLLREQRAVFFLVHKTLIASHPPSVKGVRFLPNGWVDFRRIWFQPVVVRDLLGE